MVVSVSYLVTEKYDPTRKEIGLKVTIKGFEKFSGAKIRLSGFPSVDKTFSKTGTLTFTGIGQLANNTIEVIDAKSSKVLQQISSINTNILTKGNKDQEIIIKHKTKSAEIIAKNITALKNEYLRATASPKISLFFGIDENEKPIYTRKADAKGCLKTEITGQLTDEYEVKILTGQMVVICSIKPPEP